MPLTSAVMKDITHYFRPSSSKSESFVKCNEDLSTDDGESYFSESDDSSSPTPKKRAHLIVQVPGNGSSRNSAQKRKLTGEIHKKAKKNKQLRSHSPIFKRQRRDCANEDVEESFYMSPLRLDSDSSPEDSPSLEVTSLSHRSPVYRTSANKKDSLRVTKNALLAKNKTRTSDDSFQGEIDSSLLLESSIRAKIEVLVEKERPGSLHRYFENVSVFKLENENCLKGADVPLNTSSECNLSAAALCDSHIDTVKGKAKLKNETAKSQRIPCTKRAFNRHMEVGNTGVNSQKVKSDGQSSKMLNISTSLFKDNDREAGTSNANKCGDKSFRASPKSVFDSSKSNTDNNLLNYFVKAVSPRNSKRLRIKNRIKNGNVESEALDDSRSSIDALKRVTSVTQTRSQVVNLELLSTSAHERKNGNNSPGKSCTLKKKVKSQNTRDKSVGRVNEVNLSNGDVGASKSSQNQPRVYSTRSSTHRLERRRARECKSSWVVEENKGTSSLLTGRMGKPESSKKEKLKKIETSLHQKLRARNGSKASEEDPPKKSHQAGKKIIKPRIGLNKSAKQHKAAAIVRRACQQSVLHQRIQRIRGNSDISGPSTSDDVIILSEKMKSGETKKIVIRPSYVKLAPLFSAKDTLQKKKVFLQSGAPEIVVRRMKQQKRMEVELQEASEYPSISHTLQKDSSFLWCLDRRPDLAQHFLLRYIDPLEQERMVDLSSRKLCLGEASSLPSFLASMLINLRPPLPGPTSYNCNSPQSPENDESAYCFCVAMSPDISIDEKSQEYSMADVEMFERVHAWLMRSLLPPGVAFKMCVDLSSFLPIPSTSGFHYNHISALPSSSPGQLLRKQMLIKLKEEYPMFPVNRRYKTFYQRRKSYGGLHQFSHPPSQEVITLDCSPPKIENDKCNNSVTFDDLRVVETPFILRRSRRKSIHEHSTPLDKVKETVDVSSDNGVNSVLSINDTAVKASCSSLLTSESWADIFAPASYSDACSLGRNLKTLEKLKSWLDCWTRRSAKGSKKRKNTLGWNDSEEEYSSGIEFCSSDDDDDVEAKKTKNLPTNVAILIGPCGSGKTSSVYALAKEMNYKVLEINASSKRTGKYILATVQEATRSYQVMSSGGVGSLSSIGSFFKKATPNNVGSYTQKNTQNNSTKSSEKASSAMSLIFVEDVDVVFENEDEGFIGALTSLTTSSKRPVILEVHTSKPLRMGTTNNWLLEETLTETCPHLINFLAKQNRTPLILPFEHSRSNFCAEALLRVACLVEGVWVSKQWSECLFKQTAGDFRRAMQEAQFWAGSVGRSSAILENLTRYPKEVTQKSETSNDTFAGGLLGLNHAPVNFCGCVGIRSCSYPYSWMYKNYIQHIWLRLDQIVEATSLFKHDVVSSKNRSYQASNLYASHGLCLKSALVGGENSSKKNSKIISPKSEVPQHKTHLLSSCNDIIKTEKPVVQDKMNLPSPQRESPRISRRRFLSCHSLKQHIQCQSEPHSLSRSNRAKRKIKFTAGNEEKIKENIVMEDASEELNLVLREKKCFSGDHKFSRKTNITIFSDYLDILCTSDVFLKKFSDGEGLEMGKKLVYGIGSLTNLVNLSMQVSSSEKSRDFEAKQVKDSCTAAQYQMILPIVPNYWILNCPGLALDVAPHIRETCRILDDLTKTGKTRTRLSQRLPTINRVGPTLREALCRTLVEAANNEVLPDVQIKSEKKEEICQ